jgi:hypothetical protein
LYNVFTPLATFLGEQDRRLKMLGLGIGSFGVAKKMFGRWGRTGVVRGVIVIAKRLVVLETGDYSVRHVIKSGFLAGWEASLRRY